MKRIQLRIWICLVVIALLFCTIACEGMYKAVGFTQPEAAEQAGKDKEAAKVAIEQGRVLIWQLVTATIGSVGTIATILLGKWLKTERTITATIIRGVEKADEGKVKAAVSKLATAAGVEAKLNKRVNKLT